MRTQMQIPARFETSQVPAINRSSGDSLADSQNGKMLNAEINWTAQSSLSDSFMDLGAHTDCRGSAEGGHDYPVSYPKSVLARSVLESCTSIGLTARGLTAFGSLGVSPAASAIGRLRASVGYIKRAAPISQSRSQIVTHSPPNRAEANQSSTRRTTGIPVQQDAAYWQASQSGLFKLQAETLLMSVAGAAAGAGTAG